MAIAQEFIDFIVPIEVIRRKYPGGWAQCLLDHKSAIGGRVWFDHHLFRDGAMSPAGIQDLVAHWRELGFETHREEGGEPVEWLDVCVSEGHFGGPTLPCAWIAYDETTRGAYLKAHPAGPLVGPRR
jgi:hypothetical protein